MEDYKTNTHYTVAGVLVFIGVIIIWGVPSFPKNIIVPLIFFSLAIISFKILKTSKSISIDDRSISLGKFVGGFKKMGVDSSFINSIELIHEIKGDFSPNMAMATGDGNIEVHSKYYLINLIGTKSIKFDNLYDDQLQVDLKDFCNKNSIESNFEIIRNISN